MAATIRQILPTNSAGNAGTLPLAFPIAVLPGSTIVVFGTCDSQSSPTVSCATNVDGSLGAVLVTVNDPANQQEAFAFAKQGVVGGSTTVTLTFGASIISRGIWIVELIGARSTGGATEGAIGNLQPSPGPLGTDAITTGLVVQTQPGLLLAVGFGSAGDSGVAGGTGFSATASDWGFGGPGLAIVESVHSSSSKAATFTAGDTTAHISIGLFVPDAVVSSPTLKTQQRIPGAPLGAPLPGIVKLGQGVLKAPSSKNIYILSTSSGSYSLSGQAANFVYFHSPGPAMAQPAPMVMGLGLGGRIPALQNTPLGQGILAGGTSLRSYMLSTVQGSYALAGQAAGLLQGHKMPATQGVYALAGQAAGLLSGKRLTATQGAYALAGQAAGLLQGHKLAATQGVYVLTGEAANLLKARVLAAVQGSYTLTGEAAGLLYDRRLTAAQGVYTLTGEAANLIYSAVGHYILTATQGSYALTGKPLGLLLGRKLAANQGAYAVAGSVINFINGRRLIITPGVYSLAGNAAGLAKARLLTASQGSYALTGEVAAFLLGRRLSAVRGLYGLTGEPVILVYSGAAPPVVIGPVQVVSGSGGLIILVTGSA